MAEPKPFASLSSGLLARKGAAKPAMRPQGFGSFGSNLEDLGWNDMGQGPEEHVPTPIHALTPAPGGRRHVELVDEPLAEIVEEPAVVEQQRTLSESFQQPEAAPESEPEPVAEIQPEPRLEPAPVVSLSQRRAAAGQPGAAPAKAKAAFTLRLDPERHLKLRLACAISRRSAQQLVTAALDEFLESQPELEALAGHLPAEAGHRSR
jgi:hypothetical protein